MVTYVVVYITIYDNVTRKYNNGTNTFLLLLDISIRFERISHKACVVV